jgi:hypothetical protein
VQFIRINGNRVIRVEIAKIGKPPLVFTKDEVDGMMRTDGTPLTAENAHPVEMGDVQRDADKQAPAAPPTLRGAGETAPNNGPTSNNRVGTMKPVQFPKQAPDDHPVAHQGEQKPPTQPDSQTQGSADAGQPAQQSSPPDNAQAPVPDASQAKPSKPQAKPPNQTEDGSKPQE